MIHLEIQQSIPILAHSVTLHGWLMRTLYSTSKNYNTRADYCHTEYRKFRLIPILFFPSILVRFEAREHANTYKWFEQEEKDTQRSSRPFFRLLQTNTFHCYQTARSPWNAKEKRVCYLILMPFPSRCGSGFVGITWVLHKIVHNKNWAERKGESKYSIKER